MIYYLGTSKHFKSNTVADPWIPVGGVDLVGGADSWGSYVSKILYVETKESGPLRGLAPDTIPLDPPM